jgi:hypothetical protein
LEKAELYPQNKNWQIFKTVLLSTPCQVIEIEIYTLNNWSQGKI